MAEKDTNRIEASPTKELFIYMLTRDIPLSRAILDLVDNSVDGATNLVHNDDYSHYWIRIDIKEDKFSISDNCGGISIETARDYAFRFGRPKEMASTPGSIGKFGVGMKRSFFKLGNRFKVESTTKKSKFIIDHDVKKWLEDSDNWHFEFKEKDTNVDDIDEKAIGTKIEVTELFKNVSANFKLENYLKEINSEIEMAHSLAIDKGLSISLNGRPLGKRTLTLLKSDKLKPAYYKKEYLNFGKSVVTVRIYAGIAERNFQEGGWYVFCNGRMVLEADQTSITTWGVNNMPKYHPIYAYFKGFVFFDSDDAELLPWTTTKTGIDGDSSLYKIVRLEMVNLIRPILKFLRDLDAERVLVENEEIENSPLKNIYDDTATINYKAISETANFSSPKKILIKRGPRLGRILYNKPKDQIEKLQKMLKVVSNKAVGEKTFEYFIKMECED